MLLLHELKLHELFSMLVLLIDITDTFLDIDSVLAH